jgi:hypothetical protein
MVFKAIVIFLVIAVLLEDGSSIKKTEEEERENRELAEKVNATLAEEEEKERQEEEEREKKRLDQEKKRKGTGKEKGQDEACPTLNQTCPEQEPCPEVTKCPEKELCPVCPEVKECPPYEECRPCPKVRECVRCPEMDPCVPCEECPPRKECGQSPFNHTDVQTPGPGCSDPTGMSVPVALAVGASAGVLLAGVSAAIGLALRYASPIVSGFLFICFIVITWYLSSRYPEVARELGGQVIAVLREATVALGHRVMEAVRHHNDQVGFPNMPYLSLRLSSIFHLKSLH